MKQKLGKVSITPRGAWDTATEYKRLDAVSNGGVSWLAMQDSTGVTPAEGENWMMLTQKQIDDGTVELDTAWSSKHTVDMLCPEITATGNPVVLEDCVEGYPMDVAASWDIQQEGEGTPHIAGYGANLLDITKCSAPSYTSYGLTASISGDTVVITGTASGIEGKSYMSIVFTPDYTLSGKGYVITAFPIKGTIPMIYGLRTETEKAIAIQLPNYADGETVDLQFRIMVSASTPTEYEIYGDNIRPFVGRDSVIVNRHGKNLWKWGDVEGNSTESFGYPCSIDIRNFPDDLVGTPITMRCFDYLGMNQSTTYDTVHFYNANGKRIFFMKNGVVAKGITFTLTDKPSYAYFYAGYPNVSGGHYRKIMLVAGSIVPTEYEPYKEQSQAVYTPSIVTGAGSFDKDGNGVEDIRIFQFDGTEKLWISSSYGAGRYWFNGDRLYDPSPTGSYPLYCSHFPQISFNEYAENISIGLAHDTALCFSTPYKTQDEWKNFLAEQYAAGTPVMVAYTLKNKRNFTVSKATTIPALSTNIITTDADAVTATARKDPIKTIANLTDRISALEAAATNISEV